MLRWSPGSVKRASPTVVSYQLTRGASVSLVIRDANGKTIRSAFGGRTQRSGRQTWTWDGRNASRKVVPAGRYLAVLTVKTGLGTSTIMRTLIVK
jgi:flagellar hook assembly protein FlgD